MQLETVEIMALERMLDPSEQGTLEVIERTTTKAGFYSILRYQRQALPLSQESERVWRFKHPALREGGFFICWPICEDTLCLEGVSNSGPWPNEFAPDAFA